MQCYAAVGGDLLRGAATHVVVLAVDARAAAGVYLGEVSRAVVGIVGFHHGAVVGVGLAEFRLFGVAFVFTLLKRNVFYLGDFIDFAARVL